MLLSVLVVALPLAHGGVEVWAQGATTATTLLALVLLPGDLPALTVASAALAGVLALLVAQLVPVPALVHRLSPGATRIFEASLAPLGLYPAARPLSLDPAETARELAKAIAGFAAFVVACSLSNTRRRRQKVLVALALSGIAAASTVLAFALIGAGPLVAPNYPFVNRNHLASLLNLSAFVALALAVRARGQARVLWLFGFAATSTVSVLTLSRGGLIALLVGAAIFLALHLRTNATADHRAMTIRATLVVGGLVVALGVAGYLAFDPLVAKLETLRGGAGDTRWALWRPALQLLRDFPVVGVGRGAFSDVFAGYQLESATYQFTHVENDWLQVFLDLGIPGGLLLIGAFAGTWFFAARRRDLSETEVGLLAATAAVAVQNAVDFSLELLGVAIPFAVAMGLLARRQRTWRVRGRVLRPFVAVLGLFAAVGLAIAWRHDQRREQASVLEPASGNASAQNARAAALWHPADWLPHAVAGVRLSAERRCGEAMPWLIRAMALSPSAPAPHLAAARCLAGRDDRSARREYRLAILFGSPALPEAAARYPALRDLFDVAPATPDGVLALGSVLEASRPDDAVTVFRRALDEYSDERALLPLARLSARRGDHEAAVAFARRYEATARSDASACSIAASSLFQLGRATEAQAELERGLAAAPGSPLLIRMLVERAFEAGRWSEARRLADEIAPRDAPELAQKLLLESRALAGQGRLAEAIDRAKSAAASLPGDPAPLLSVAGLCEQAGRYADALAALRRAAAIRPDADVRARVSRMEATVASEEARTQQRMLLRDGGAVP